VPRDMSSQAAAAFRVALAAVGTSAMRVKAGQGGESSLRDPQLAAVANAFGLAGVAGGTWLQMFCALAEQLPFAMVINDMKVPGLPITFCNSAFVSLTGYSKADAEGRNCRFLQGPATEAAAVRVMVNALRGAKVTTLRVTNHRSDGTPFTNVLTIQPVHDSRNEYRYAIGLLSDGANTAKDNMQALAKLRSALPTTFDASLQEARSNADGIALDTTAQRKQWRASMAKFTRLLWSMDWEASLKALMKNANAIQTFTCWLGNESDVDAVHADMLNEAAKISSSASPGNEAAQICSRYLSSVPPSAEAAIAVIKAKVDEMIGRLASEAFPRFVQSKACLPLVEQLVGGTGDEVKRADHLLWKQYTVPEDCAGWVHSFASVAETYPACIVICDSTIPGNPMVFTNQEFCRVTGYAKDECQGRNCRFLQGPLTEPQSVAVIQDTLRRGVDCHVKITNYRKSGELFENLLTMRPVHDSNGVYRFCIGVQFEIIQGTSLKSRLSKLDKLIKLLPRTIEVASVRTGIAHDRNEAAIEQQTSLEVKLESALAGATVGPKIEGVIGEAGFYADHHVDMLSHIGASAGWRPLQQMVDISDGGDTSSKATGAAAGHSHLARYEAARKFIMNHAGVARDITNPNPSTQTELKRVDVQDIAYVEQLLRETARRLLGRYKATEPPREEKLNTSDLRQATAWHDAIEYLLQRIQDRREQMVGRTPDMSEAAGAAVRGVLAEIHKTALKAKKRSSAVSAEGQPSTMDATAMPSAPPVGIRTLFSLSKLRRN